MLKLPKNEGLNIVPFIDIMLVLLAIILSISTFIAHGKIEINLPVSENALSLNNDEKKLSISIDENNIFYLDDKTTDLKGLSDAISSLHKKTIVELKNHRYHYSVMEAKKIIDSKSMGKLLWMKGTYGKAGSIDYDKNWRNYKNKSGGGILIDQGIHMLDLMRYLSGEEFEKINSFVTNAYWNIEVEDNAFAIMKTYSNVIAMLHSSATHWKHKFLLEMYFEEGYINLDGILSGTRSYAPETLVVGRREFEDITFAMGKPKESITWFENDNSWEIEIKEFLDAVQGEKSILNGTSIDALQTLLLIERIYNNSGFYNE